MAENLNEEIKRIKTLFNFKVGDNAHDVLSEQNIHDSLIEQQKYKHPNTQKITTPLSGVHIDGYWTLPTLPITKKLSKEEMSNILADDMFVAAIQAQLTANKVAPISDANALKLSQYWVNRIKTDKKFNRLMRKSIAARQKETDPIIEINVMKITNNLYSGPIKTSVSSNTGTPELKLINKSGKELESGNGSDISAYINNYNFDNLGKVQGLINKKDTKDKDIGNKRAWVLEESTIPGNFIVSTPTDRGTPATTKKGGTKPITVPIPIGLTDLFQVGQTTSGTDIQEAIRSSLNQGVINYNNENGTSYTLGNIVSANIIGSASNSWNSQRISPTHAQGVTFNAPAMTGNDSSNQPVDAWVANMDFTQSPAGQSGLRGNDLENAGLAWRRTQDIINAINEIQPNPSVRANPEWRVTDSGGQTGPAGQFAQMTAQVELVGKEDLPDVHKKGSNRGTIRQLQYVIRPMAMKGGRPGSGGWGPQKSLYTNRKGEMLNHRAQKRRKTANINNRGWNAPRRDSPNR